MYTWISESDLYNYKLHESAISSGRHIWFAFTLIDFYANWIKLGPELKLEFLNDLYIAFYVELVDSYRSIGRRRHPTPRARSAVLLDDAKL